MLTRTQSTSVEPTSGERNTEQVEEERTGNSETKTVSEKTESVDKEPEEVEEAEGGGKGEVRGEVDRVMEEVKGEVERVAGEVRQERLKEQQEAQDRQFSWLKDSAKVLFPPPPLSLSLSHTPTLRC